MHNEKSLKIAKLPHGGYCVSGADGELLLAASHLSDCLLYIEVVMTSGNKKEDDKQLLNENENRFPVDEWGC